MPVCHKRKLAFCHIPRTGGVSITKALDMEVKDKHFKASYYREHFPEYKLFTVIRTYEERVKSVFGWLNFLSLDDLAESVIDLGVDNLSLMLKPNEYFLDAQVDYVLNFNNLQQDLNIMLNDIKQYPVQLEKLNTLRNEHQTSY